MNAWDKYTDRIQARGGNKRTAALNRLKRQIETKSVDSLSYKSMVIDGVAWNVDIEDTDILTEKKLFSMPGYKIPYGGMVFWADAYWLITAVDYNDEVYSSARMTQCNHLLKWVSDDGVIHEQWCVIEDGTKYLTGEYEDRNFIVTRGDSRIAMTISRNKDTVRFTREHRFIIDDDDSPIKLAYLLTKPLKTGTVYNGAGVFKYVLQEVVTTDDDNLDLGIADYYKYFPVANKPSYESQPGTATHVEADHISEGWI